MVAPLYHHHTPVLTTNVSAPYMASGVHGRGVRYADGTPVCVQRSLSRAQVAVSCVDRSERIDRSVL